MKKIMMLLWVMLVLVGCTTEDKNDVTKDTNKDIQTSTTDSQTKENIEMPTLNTIEKQLGISVKDMNILEQKDDYILFSFFDDNFTISENQARYLEGIGYQMTLYDGTISSTFVMEKGNQKISITIISELNAWKEVHQDEMNVNAINDNENCVYEIVNQ